MAPVRIVSSLADVDAALQDLHITQMNQANQVRFQLDERAPLEEAAMIGERTRPGRHGCILVNPELLECKTKTKGTLERDFKNMLAASLKRMDQELLGVEASIAALKVLLLKNDNQIPQDPSFEQPYATQQERDEAAARDRRAQRALWHAKLEILEMRQSILKDKRSETMSKMTELFNRIMDEPSHLGAGYADRAYPPLV